jgi:hypothetical protein
MTVYQSVRLYVNIVTNLSSVESGAGRSAQLPKESKIEIINREGMGRKDLRNGKE